MTDWLDRKLAQIDEALDALDTPDSREVYEAILPYDKRMIEASIGAVALNPAPGTLPSGGTTGQVLAKESDSDGDVGWEDSGGGSQPELLEVTLTAAELAARWDGGDGVAYVELPDPVPGDQVLVAYVVSNSLDQNAVPQTVQAFTSGESSANVVSGGESLAFLAVFNDGSFSSTAVFTDAVATLATLLPGCSAYVGISADGAPTTGELVVRIWRLVA